MRAYKEEKAMTDNYDKHIIITIETKVVVPIDDDFRSLEKKLSSSLLTDLMLSPCGCTARCVKPTCSFTTHQMVTCQANLLLSLSHLRMMLYFRLIVNWASGSCLQGSAQLLPPITLYRCRFIRGRFGLQ